MEYTLLDCIRATPSAGGWLIGAVCGAGGPSGMRIFQDTSSQLSSTVDSMGQLRPSEVCLYSNVSLQRYRNRLLVQIAAHTACSISQAAKHEIAMRSAPLKHIGSISSQQLEWVKTVIQVTPGTVADDTPRILYIDSQSAFNDKEFFQSLQGLRDAGLVSSPELHTSRLLSSEDDDIASACKMIHVVSPRSVADFLEIIQTMSTTQHSLQLVVMDDISTWIFSTRTWQGATAANRLRTTVLDALRSLRCPLVYGETEWFTEASSDSVPISAAELKELGVALPAPLWDSLRASSATSERKKFVAVDVLASKLRHTEVDGSAAARSNSMRVALDAAMLKPLSALTRATAFASSELNVLVISAKCKPLFSSDSSETSLFINMFQW